MVLETLKHLKKDLKMNDLKVVKKDRAYFIAEIAKVIETGQDAKHIADFLENNKKLLSEDEFITAEIRTQKLPDGYVGLLTPDYQYSINIKRTTIIIVALLLDLKFTSGFASTFMTLTGLSNQSVKKLQKSHKCLVAEISLKKGCRQDELDFENKECVWNNLECDYRKDGIYCGRSKQVIKSNISDLLKSGVIKEIDGKLKICF